MVHRLYGPGTLYVLRAQITQPNRFLALFTGENMTADSMAWYFWERENVGRGHPLRGRDKNQMITTFSGTVSWTASPYDIQSQEDHA